jgi:predicted acyl esterase
MLRRGCLWITLTLGLLTISTVANSQSRLPDVTHEGIEIKEIWIPMPDGVRLAASLFMPANRETTDTFPVLLEYLPYRKDESRKGRFALFSYFVVRGYIVARVDIRGTGTSEGKLIEYEYTDQEQEDGEVVIDWLSNQAWSTGKVGMFGISWGAFNSIQMAMRNPPALKAIVAIQGTDDLFRDDVHFMDGMMHIDSYEIGVDVANILPAPPDYVVNEAYFRDRFDTEPWLLKYKRQQRDGPFWNRASLDSNYSSIDIPTFVIGGWYDGYRDSVPRMLEKLDVPVKGMVGPWAHTWPNLPYPEPGMEWRHEAVRWFDHWLKAEDTGILDEPRFAIYVRQWHPPGVVDTVPGYWRWEDGWPIERTRETAFYARSDHTLSEVRPRGGEGKSHRLRYVPTVGVEASGNVNWWGDFPWDQRGTDAYSLVYDSEPLEHDLEILGFPRAVLHVSADAPLANWIVRISDIAPDGTVTQVAGAGKSGAQRNSPEEPESLVPGQLFKLEYDLHFTSWVFPRGHRIRLAVNNALWPMIWPTPHAMTTMLDVEGANASHILLPVMPESKRTGPEFLPPAENPELPGYSALELDDDSVSGYAETRSIERIPLESKTRAVASGASGSLHLGTKIKYSEEIVHEAQDTDPARASVTGKTRYIVELDGRTLTVEGILSFTSDREDFFYTYTRRLLENGKLIREKTWEEAIPRDHH